MRIHRLLPALLALLLLPADPLRAVEDDPVLVTLQQVKTSYRDKKYPQAEDALRHLAELAAAPEREAARPMILPALHFYSAAVAFAQKDEDRARASLRQFFALAPDASVDPAAYPKSFRIFFDAQKTEAAREAPPAGPESIGGAAVAPYATSGVDEAAVPANTGAADWAEGPVRFLMDEKEKRAFLGLSDDSDRRAFVNDFWARRDPDPATSVNEFQVEFYRRVQYAEANFSTESVRGAQSDRGMVFLLLGPPSYIGRAAMAPGQDMMNVLRTTEIVMVPSATGGAALLRLPSNRATITPGSDHGEMETWYYRRDRMMKGLPFSELQYQFVTKRGYGVGVLQKEPIPLTALRKAARLLQSRHG